jgi:transcriptional regulator with XRE-family HTH domain
MTISVVETARRSLDELADIANREHELTQAAATSMLEHAIAAGTALLEAKDLCGHGNWIPWLEANFHATGHLARIYMRLSRHQDKVREAGFTGIGQAQAWLAREGTPAAWDSKPPWVHEEARRLRFDEKMTLKEIAEELRVSPTSVHRWVDPGAYERARLATQRYMQRQRDAQAALERQGRERSIKRAGGSIAESYAFVRRALQSLDRALEQEQDREAKEAIRSAMQRMYGVEDQIVAASRRSMPLREAA